MEEADGTLLGPVPRGAVDWEEMYPDVDAVLLQKSSVEVEEAALLDATPVGEVVRAPADDVLL